MPNKVAMKRHRTKRVKQPVRVKLVPIVCITLLIVVMVTLGFGMVLDMRDQQAELDRRHSELQQALEQKRNEARRLEAIESQIGTPEYIEQIAREELGMGKPDELRFVD